MKIPKEILDQHVVILGKTRSGKSSVLRGTFIEPLMDDNKPVCIIDPKGDHWGLKSSADGKKPGYAVIIFGGDHADIPINEHAGAHVAELVATGNRPCIIDLGGWMVGPRTRFFVDFASNLFKHARGRRWIVIDEVHNFAPQGKVLDPDSGKMLHWANRIAGEGLGKGIALLAASQRPQKVHKDFLDSCETLIAMKAIHPRARAAIKEWIDGCGDPQRGGEVMSSLANLARREGWIWNPEAGIGPKRMSFPPFKTYDSFAPQPVDTRKLKGWADVDLDDVRKKLDAVIAEQRANDPKELHAQIIQLKRELAAAQKTQSKSEIRTISNPIILNGEVKRIEKIVDHLKKFSEQIGELSFSLSSSVLHLTEVIRPALAPKQLIIPKSIPSVESMTITESSRLPVGERAVLSACIQYPDGLSREQLTVLTGYRRSSRDAYIARLKAKGFVTAERNIIIATDAGRLAVPDVTALPTGELLREHWLRRLPEGERKILKLLIDHYPSPVRRDQIDELTGYLRSSRDAYLSRLSAKELVEEHSRGEVIASSNLFL